MKTQFTEYHNRILAELDLPARVGKLVAFPSQLDPEIKNYFQQQQIHELYTHQSEMFAQAVAGKNVVITTATASGKTISFLLPVLQKILADPASRAFFIYPTKALAHDQYRNLQPILEYFGKSRIQAGVYDGDTPVTERNRLRKEANIILTNPEMLHGAFLPNHSLSGFHGIFSRLRFVILDELHIYRGAFGSHLSNVMRRLKRVCKYYGSSPQMLFSSATIANPQELAQNIAHVPFSHISEDGSPQAAKRIYIWQPPFVGDSSYRKKPEEEAAELIPDLVQQGERFIAFCPSRRQVEVVLKEARDQLSHLQDQPTLGRDLSDQVAGYRGGYTKTERKQIEQRLANGQLKGVISTNALELGIDIGDIQTVLLCGFPNTKASFWQQVGRAGRKSQARAILFLDMNSTDQYIAIHPNYLFETGMEHAVIDKDNLFIQLAHLRAAAAEIPLSLQDASLFPDIGEIIPVLIKAQELHSEHGNFHWRGGEYPAGDFNLRNISQDTYKVINKEDETMVTEMDESQAFREVYPKAIYIHGGRQYFVEDLDLTNRIAWVLPIDVNYFTVPFVETDVSIIKEFRQYQMVRSQVCFGDVQVRETIPAYKMVQFHNHQNLGYEAIRLSLVQSLETEAVWLAIPPEVMELFEKHKKYNFHRGLEHALLQGAMLRTMGTREDMNATFFTTVNAQQSGHKQSHILLYDLYPGGLGFTEKAFELVEEILADALNLVQNCSCKEGCPACVGDYFLDRKVIEWGLHSFMTPSEPPAEVNITPAPTWVREEKAFAASELPESWPEFVEFLAQRGERLSDFFSQVQQIQWQDNKLLLCLPCDFLGQWVLDPNNKKKIENIIRAYAEVPSSFTIQVKAKQQGKQLSERVMRRLDDLKKLE